MAQLHFWQASGDESFASRVQECADGLLKTATWRGGGVYWPIPADFDSALAGLTHYGFAHGIAGIGSFLLAAGVATNDDRYLQMAAAAGRTLTAAVCWDGERAWWPTGQEPDPSEPIRMPHWCSGSSGVGTFLIRLWLATGEDQYREQADGAAHAVRDNRWHMTSTYCHGLAGDGQFLLDLADLLDEPRYHAWAEELATCLHARAACHDGRLVVPDASGEVTAGYGSGMAGMLSFLLRLRHGGPRPWMIDDASQAHAVLPSPVEMAR
jgi:lantibiotic modifying enzyme